MVAGSIFVMWWMITFTRLIQSWEDEKVISYEVDVPKPAGDGTALEKLSIKVSLNNSLPIPAY